MNSNNSFRKYLQYNRIIVPNFEDVLAFQKCLPPIDISALSNSFFNDPKLIEVIKIKIGTYKFRQDL